MATSTPEIKDITVYDTEKLVELLKNCNISTDICEIFKSAYNSRIYMHTCT